MNPWIAATAGLSMLAVAAETSAQTPPDGIAAISAIATRSQCAAHVWKNRGRALPSYMQGMALTFARAVCHPERADVQVVSAPVDLSARSDDGLAVYKDIFSAAGMRNDQSGVDTLRHSYTLLIGLGMRESSGKFCEGRDVSQCFTTADSAEAGLFQTSFGARRFSPVLEPMFQAYSADQKGCMQDAFKGAMCRIVHSANPTCPTATSDVAGTGPGADWQRLTKTCPAFATEYGAVILRTHGGPRGEFNPIRKREAELLPKCDSMLQQVQSFVQQHPEICPAL